MKRKHKKQFIFWFSRLSALLFVSLTFYLALDDIKMMATDYPVVFNFLIGCVVLGFTISFWNSAKTAGLVFISAAVIFALLSWKQFLIINVLFMAVWLLLTGILYLASYQPPRRRARVYARTYVNFRRRNLQ